MGVIYDEQWLHDSNLHNIPKGKVDVERECCPIFHFVLCFFSVDYMLLQALAKQPRETMNAFRKRYWILALAHHHDISNRCELTSLWRESS
jgi:hypothetical protein